MDRWERLRKLEELHKKARKVHIKYASEEDRKTIGTMSVYFGWCIEELVKTYRKLDKVEEKLDDLEEELQTEKLSQAQFDVLGKDE